MLTDNRRLWTVDRVLRRDLLVVILIAALAFGIRVYAPWRAVFDGDRVNFLETDAWYHVRLIENQVRNWPWRITADPYAAPDGQFVPIAPLFDTTIASAVVLLHGRDAETRDVERIAAFAPPVFGALAVMVIWVLACRVFDRRAGLIAAALLAVLPGHFLDRTLLGFVDHHALEALLALAVFWTVSAGSPLAGIALGLYLLAWGSGALLVAILAIWLVLFIPLTRSSQQLARLARTFGIAALVAFILVVLFQDPRMHRYGSQILGLIGLSGIALAIHIGIGRNLALPNRRSIVLALSGVAALASVITWWFAPELLRQLAIDLGRLAPDPGRMSVLEARPLFLYPGQWTWHQPWIFFRSGFYVGLIALAALTVRVWHRRDPFDLGIWMFAAVSFVATIGQNRFGYYLVPACALLAGWLATVILEWGGVIEREGVAGHLSPANEVADRAQPRWPLQREIAIVVVSGMFVPNLLPGAMPIARAGTMPAYWHDTVTWLRTNTPPPFSASDVYYFARYAQPLPSVDYSIMNWWDHGYFITQTSRRVPVANPTQVRAPNAARFYAATSEADAVAILDRERARFVLADWELPFRLAATGTMMGRFQSVIDWAGAERARYYEVYYRNRDDEWIPVWVFHRPYYESMAYRLTVLGGKAASPGNTTTVIAVADRVDTSGVKFREIISQETFATFEAAENAAARTRAAASDRTLIVGVDPWRSAFPLAAISSLALVHDVRTTEQAITQSPWVRIFERVQ